jgi:hypothetical protein
MESLEFRCNNVLPITRVNSAVYGKLNDVSRLMDATTEVQVRIMMYKIERERERERDFISVIVD